MGCFGETIIRKFGKEPPEEWIQVLGVLTQEEIARGMKRLVFSWKGPPPDLPAFVRLCRAIGDLEDLDDHRPLMPLLPGKEPECDKWEEIANTHLLSYIAHRAQRGVFYCTDQDRRCVHRGANWKPSEKTAAMTAALVAYKKAWAVDMREWFDQETGEITVPSHDQQRSAWIDCMKRAEEQIKEIRAQS